MTPEELDIAAAIEETPADCVYRGAKFRVTAPQPKRGEVLTGADILKEKDATITALARDFRPFWEKSGAEKVKTRITIDGEIWRIADAQLDSKKAGYVLALQTTEK